MNCCLENGANPGYTLKTVKRSVINKTIKRALEYITEMNFKLPIWAMWSKDTWLKNKESCTEIFRESLGWDVTEFGTGDIEKRGMVLFTFRNGEKKSYCEKIIIIECLQKCPMHFHWVKTEDIINRGGDRLVFQLYNSDKEGEYTNENIKVSIDGIANEFKPGELITLDPGQSICLEPYTYHSFWTENEKGRVLIGEVSKHNDDKTDNRFKEPIPRFPTIEEDEEPVALLVGDYERFLK